ncbi:hypothetical protein PoB_002766800 [Plakobranchus ocellatus]|uniref:Uncharacterized protein n=1 Tax=Plakobranchus ocellatus TaxID=259542 RepID=A0AAV4A1Z4_9GAST|nr:hypothetical protein PoB_002766800 [Plakobranchus ocellatus]
MITGGGGRGSLSNFVTLISRKTRLLPAKRQLVFSCHHTSSSVDRSSDNKMPGQLQLDYEKKKKIAPGPLHELRPVVHNLNIWTVLDKPLGNNCDRSGRDPVTQIITGKKIP